MKSARPRRPPVRPAAVPLAAALLAVGCGGPAEPVADPAAAVADAADDNAAGGNAGRATRAGLAPFTDPAGRKWLNETIPYDAFATAPDRATAATPAGGSPGRDLLSGIGTAAPTLPGDRPGGRGAIAPPPVGGMPGAGMTAGGMGGGGMSGGGGGEEDADATGWAAVISAEDLRDEIKRGRNALAAAVATVAAFNRDREALPGEAAVLAAMAQITAEHPGRVPWKPHADAVRTLAVRVGEAASQRGRTARDEARASFDPLDSVLGGNPPPDGATAEFDRVLDADRAALMQRMQVALNFLQQEAPDADALVAKGGDLARQAAALAALSRFTAHEAYDNAAEADYQRWANDLTAAAIDAGRNARETPNYPAYRAAVDRAAQTCTACHGAYRF